MYWAVPTGARFLGDFSCVVGNALRNALRVKSQVLYYQCHLSALNGGWERATWLSGRSCTQPTDCSIFTLALDIRYSLGMLAEDFIVCRHVREQGLRGFAHSILDQTPGTKLWHSVHFWMEPKLDSLSESNHVSFKIISKYALFIYRSSKLKVPDWVDIVRNSCRNELSPYDEAPHSQRKLTKWKGAAFLGVLISLSPLWWRLVLHPRRIRSSPPVHHACSRCISVGAFCKIYGGKISLVLLFNLESRHKPGVEKVLLADKN